MNTPVFKNINVFLMGDSQERPAYIYVVHKDTKDTGYEQFWVPQTIERWGKMGFIDFGNGMYVPIARVSYITVTDPC